jgi:AcrR family transcriptional regulator
LDYVADAIQKSVLPSSEAQAMKDKLFNTAIRMAEEHGYTHVSQREVAKACGVYRNTVRHHFGTTRELQVSILRYAVQYEVLSIIAQALAVRDEWMLENITEKLQQKAGEWMLTQKGCM